MLQRFSGSKFILDVGCCRCGFSKVSHIDDVDQHFPDLDVNDRMKRFHMVLTFICLGFVVGRILTAVLLLFLLDTKLQVLRLSA